MAYSVRIYVLEPDDVVRRLSITKFSALRDDPARHRIPRYAGQRIRKVEAVVELQDRKPVWIARLAYSMLSFDGDGQLDSDAFARHQFALVELALSAPEKRATKVIDARRRFVARGGRWRPSPSQTRLLHAVILGKAGCLPV